MRATVIVLLLAFSFADAAQAQQQLTLACKGTVSSPLVQDDKPDPVSMGILVDFATRRVLGFGMPGLLDYPIMIKATNDLTIRFGGKQQLVGSVATTNGTIDRVTRHVETTVTLTDQKTGHLLSQTAYALQCSPTQRMF